MAGARVIGLYIAAFVESAGEVSSVFEKKALSMLADHGIENIEEESWYDLDSFEAAVEQIENKVGAKTTQQAAVKMIQVDDKVPNQDSAGEAFEILKEQQRNAMQNHTTEDCGQYRVEKLGAQHFRVATYGGWGYPEAFTRGLLKAVIQETESQGARVEVEPTDKSGNEQYAYEVSW
jgi:hypothetical protein